jgi:hypothetical protein
MWGSVSDVNERAVNVLLETDNPSLVGVVNSAIKPHMGMSALEKTMVFSDEKSLTNAIIKTGNIAIKFGHEGIVVRNAYPFHNSMWKENIAKYVRANHVQTNKHWSQQPITRNDVV